jgi:hypothetical protein
MFSRSVDTTSLPKQVPGTVGVQMKKDTQAIMKQLNCSKQKYLK